MAVFSPVLSTPFIYICSDVKIHDSDDIKPNYENSTYARCGIVEVPIWHVLALFDRQATVRTTFDWVVLLHAETCSCSIASKEESPC